MVTGKVAEVRNDGTIVINRGADHGVVQGMLFLVYEGGDPISDPDTGELLGSLEITKGQFRITHVQNRLAVATPDAVWGIMIAFETDHRKKPGRGDLVRSMLG